MDTNDTSAQHDPDGTQNEQTPPIPKHHACAPVGTMPPFHQSQIKVDAPSQRTQYPEYVLLSLGSYDVPY